MDTEMVIGMNASDEDGHFILASLTPEQALEVGEKLVAAAEAMLYDTEGQFGLEEVPEVIDGPWLAPPFAPVPSTPMWWQLPTSTIGVN